MILEAIDEARMDGATLRKCCALIGLDVRTVQRWRKLGRDGGCDGRMGPNTRPHNKLSDKERETLIEVCTSPEFRDLSAKQIVPILAERGVYIASESTIQRVLREEKMNKHRGKKRKSQPRPVSSHVATGPNQVWSWDISYLRSPVRGSFYYLYLFMDVWSRKIVGWRVEDREDSELAAKAMESICGDQGVDTSRIILHSDNGSPMTGFTMKAKLEELGVKQSLSRPRVSNDNAFSESLFGTMKTNPGYPEKPFKCIKKARTWVGNFVQWFNTEHRHSGISFVTPSQRHEGEQEKILFAREETYRQARASNPERWSGNVRTWNRHDQVRLNSPSEKMDRVNEVRTN